MHGQLRLAAIAPAGSTMLGVLIQALASLSPKASMNCFCLILSALCLCLSLQAGGASVINRHVPHPFLPGVVARSPLVRRDTELRQSDFDVGSCSIEEFGKKSSSVECQQSFAQPALDIYAECGYNELGDLAVDRCRTLNGKTCTEIAADEIVSLYSVCLGSDSCSSQCGATVQNTIDKLGCCFTVLDISTITSLLGVDVPSPFDLASLCGITPPSPCETSSSLTFTPSQVTTPCSTEELLDRLVREVSCNPQVQKVIIEIYESCNFDLGIDSLAAVCRENENGVICITLNGTEGSDVFNDCALAGIPSSGICSNSCRDAIQTYRNDYGCCIYNDTTFPPPSASYELWSLCGVDTVGQCKSTLDPLIGSAMTLAMTKVTIIFALLALLV